jgi:hypothetical protein
VGNNILKALIMVMFYIWYSVGKGAFTGLTYPAPCEQSAGLCYKSVNKGLTPFPQVDGDVEDIADEAKSCERAVQEQCEQTAIVLLI